MIRTRDIILFAIYAMPIGWSLVAQVPVATSPSSSPLCVDTVFRIQNNFWVNLHHFVRGESRRRSMNAPLELPLSSLRDEEREAWEVALNEYTDLTKLSLIFDEKLVLINNILAGMGDAPNLHSNSIEPKVAAVLNGSAQVYRARVWPKHRQENDDWIASHCSAIQRYDVNVKNAIANAFEITAPTEQLLVDLARDTGPTLAYTTVGPFGTAGHTVIAPQKNIDADVALDTIFHEISHTMDSRITRIIDNEAARQRVKVPDDLWHAVTLYTTCAITKRELAKTGNAVVQLDASRAKMFERSGWQRILAALVKDWQPHLDQKTSMEHALNELIRNASQ